MELNISLSPEVLFYIGSFPISNSFLMMIVVTVFLLVTVLMVRFRFSQVPGRLQLVFEILIESAYDFVVSVLEDEKRAKMAFPLVFTLFIFIFCANLIVFIPGQDAIVFNGIDGIVPFTRAAMADYGIVLIMTLITVITVQIVAILSYGPLGYIGKFFNLSSPLNFFLGLMDLIGEMAKIVSLSFRLFGNIFAGGVLGAVILSLVPFIVPLPFMILGLLTAVVQAFVFAVLTLVFISLAIKESDDLINT